jgi:hypothetical protein
VEEDEIQSSQPVIENLSIKAKSLRRFEKQKIRQEEVKKKRRKNPGGLFVDADNISASDKEERLSAIKSSSKQQKQAKLSRNANDKTGSVSPTPAASYQKLLRPRKKVDYTFKQVDNLLKEAEIISQDNNLSDFSTCSSDPKSESESSENETESESDEEENIEEADGKKTTMVDEKLNEEKDEAGNLEEDDQLEKFTESKDILSEFL